MLWSDGKPNHGEIRIQIDGEHWNELIGSDAMKELEEYIENLNYFAVKMISCPEAANDQPHYITEEELNERRYATNQTVWEQLMSVGSRIDRRDKILGFVAGIAVLALVIAIRAVM